MPDGTGAMAANTLELGEVISVADPEGLNRVQVSFLSRGPDTTVWALVATGFAGDGNGAFLIPDVGSRVVISCLNGDPRYPVVLGAIWDGQSSSPETLGGSGEEVDRWSFTGKAGTRIAMVEEGGSSKITLETANGNSIEIDDSNGRIRFRQGGNTVTMNSSGITLSGTTVKIEASQFELNATIATVNAPLSDFSGFIMCDLLQTNSVISSSYTPGAGNIW